MNMPMPRRGACSRRAPPAEAASSPSKVGRRAKGSPLPPKNHQPSKPHKQDLYVAVVKATIEEETVPKEKHVRS